MGRTNVSCDPMNRRTLLGAALAGLLACTAPADARVNKIVLNPGADSDPVLSDGAPFPIKRITGRAYGELDPRDPHNAIIQDIRLAPRNKRGRVEYQATFQLILPSDPEKLSGLMWHDVPNRGGRVTIVAAERNAGDVGLSSGWQGDNSGGTSQASGDRAGVGVPVAKHADGTSITRKVLGRIVNRSGLESEPILVQSSPLPYRPATLDTRKATLTAHSHETTDGKVTVHSVVPSRDWAWARCDAQHPFPGTPDPAQICLRKGFDEKLLYQVVFTAKDPYVLGIGFAAFRDVASFFRYAEKDDAGTPNPLAGSVKWVIGRGVSQSGNYLRQLIHLGFNEDAAKRRVYDGAWPIIAGRRVALNFRWAQPDGALELYQAGSEGPQWWEPWEDKVRGLPARGILDRCTRTGTCPKIIEHFGSAEVWALKLTPEWVGTDAKEDLPLPDNVRRYYIPSTTHGGGVGGFNTSLPGVGLPPIGPACPGNNWGNAIFPANPVPHTQTVNAIRQIFRNWVMNGAAPPPSVWPTLASGNLVDASKEAMGFPDIPAIVSVSKTIPSDFIMPVFDYDWGPGFNYNDTSGVASKQPPAIKRVLRMLVPRVDSDGN